jgi:hypothetical protein
MNVKDTGARQAGHAAATVAIVALVAPLLGGLVVFAMAVAMFGQSVSASELFIVVMAIAFMAGLVPALGVGAAIAWADRRGGATWRFVLLAALIGGLGFALVLVFVFNDGGLPLAIAAGATALSVVSVFVAWWCARRWARRRLPATPGLA